MNAQIYLELPASVLLIAKVNIIVRSSLNEEYFVDVEHFPIRKEN